MMDLQFNLIPDIEERLNNLNSLYTTNFQTYGLELLNKYEIDYMMLTDKTRHHYNLTDIVYVKDKTCFSEVYNSDDVIIYESKCIIKIV